MPSILCRNVYIAIRIVLKELKNWKINFQKKSFTELRVNGRNYE
jgi:hypothetical protein